MTGPSGFVVPGAVTGDVGDTGVPATAVALHDEPRVGVGAVGATGRRVAPRVRVLRDGQRLAPRLKTVEQQALSLAGRDRPTGAVLAQQHRQLCHPRFAGASDEGEAPADLLGGCQPGRDRVFEGGTDPRRAGHGGDVDEGPGNRGDSEPVDDHELVQGGVGELVDHRSVHAGVRWMRDGEYDTRNREASEPVKKGRRLVRDVRVEPSRQVSRPQVPGK
jgi:hypothetical protein